MNLIRDAVASLSTRGTLPGSNASAKEIQQYEQLIREVHPPLSDDEAALLMEILRADDDDTYGLAWSLIHLIESARGRPLDICLTANQGEWIQILRQRARSGK